MSVVTAVRNVRISFAAETYARTDTDCRALFFAQFVRLLGGTLSLAIGSTIM